MHLNQEHPDRCEAVSSFPPITTQGLPNAALSGLARDRSSAISSLLNAVPHPVLLLAADRGVLLCNAAAQPDTLACLAIAHGRVVRFAGAASENFDGVFARALAGCAVQVVVTVAQGERQCLWRMHFGRLPLGLVAEAAVLAVIDPPPAALGTSAVLQRLFGLTYAESRVLTLLLDDCRPREIAAELNVSIATVRSHLQALFAKTGTRGQTELVALAWSAA